MNPEQKASFEKCKETVLDLEAQRKVLKKNILRSKTLFESLITRNSDAIKARKFLQEIAKEVQKNLEQRISDLVSIALAAVFGIDAPKFVCEFIERRNVMECDLWFEKEVDNKKRRYLPTHGGGGGPSDVADFALRIAYWSLNKNRPTFILDEPFKFVSHDLQPIVSDMISMLCDKLKLQIIMVSHQLGVNNKADKTIEVTQENGISATKGRIEL